MYPLISPLKGHIGILYNYAWTEHHKLILYLVNTVVYNIGEDAILQIAKC